MILNQKTETYNSLGLSENKDIQDILKFVFSNLVKFYIRQPEIYGEINSVVNGKSRNLSFYSLKMLDKFTETICSGILMTILADEIKNIRIDDVREIICYNTQLVISFLHSVFISPKDAKWFRKKILNQMSKMAKTDDNVKDILNQTEISKINGLNYDSMYSSPWTPERSTEIQHKRLTLKMHHWIPMQSDVIDQTAFVLMILILIFNADFLHLNDRNSVEKIQLTMMNRLRRHLDLTYPRTKALVLMAESVQVVSLAREAFQIRMKRLPV